MPCVPWGCSSALRRPPIFPTLRSAKLTARKVGNTCPKFTPVFLVLRYANRNTRKRRNSGLVVAPVFSHFAYGQFCATQTEKYRAEVALPLDSLPPAHHRYAGCATASTGFPSGMPKAPMICLNLPTRVTSEYEKRMTLMSLADMRDSRSRSSASISTMSRPPVI